jgi:hypothetical protein
VELTVLADTFAINRAAAGAPWPALGGSPHQFLSVTTTSDELSIVAREGIVLDGFVRAGGWRCLQVTGPLAFEEIGVLANLTTVLAAARVSVFAISTYDTDYLLVRNERLAEAMDALRLAGHRIRS